ncbi:MAG: type II secretion system protein [Bacillota bacterium]
MPRFRPQRITSESGYTLLELLAVTAILMFLSLFSVPIYDQLTDKARLASSLRDLRVMEDALEAYRAEHGHYPTRLGLLTERGYIRSDFTFQSPWSTADKPRYYFYTIDTKEQPRAFLLGDPGPQPNCSQNSPVVLHASNREPLPCGTNPNDRARVFAGSEPEVLLSPAPEYPLKSLSGFREWCDPKAEKDMRVAPGCIVKAES